MDFENICPACGRDHNAPFGTKADHSINVCGACGTFYTKVKGDGVESRELYDHYYDGASFELSPIAAASLDRLVESCESFRETGNWLDLGFGEGGLLGIVEARDWKCHGIEISPRALAYGRTRGWTVREADSGLSEGSFDVITMIEFIEHASSPSTILDAVSRLLRPGGLVYLTTPNASSINRRLLGIEWSIFSPPEHLTIWSEKGLKAALAKTGLTVSRVRTEGLNPKEILDSLLPSRRIENNAPRPGRNDVAFSLNRAMSSTPSRRALKRGINQVLTILGVGDTLKVWAMKDTERVKPYAVPSIT